MIRSRAIGFPVLIYRDPAEERHRGAWSTGWSSPPKLMKSPSTATSLPQNPAG